MNYKIRTQTKYYFFIYNKLQTQIYLSSFVLQNFQFANELTSCKTKGLEMKAKSLGWLRGPTSKPLRPVPTFNANTKMMNLDILCA